MTLIQTDRFDKGSASSHVITYPTGTDVGDFLLVFLASSETPNAYNTPSGWQQQTGGVAATLDNGAHVFWKMADTEGETSVTIGVTSGNDDPHGFIVRIPSPLVRSTIGTLISSNNSRKQGRSQANASFPAGTVTYDPIDSRPLVSDRYHWFLFTNFERASHVTAFTNPTGWTLVDTFTEDAGLDEIALWYLSSTADTVTPSTITVTSDESQANHVISVGIGVLANEEPATRSVTLQAKGYRVQVQELPYMISSGMMRKPK